MRKILAKKESEVEKLSGLIKNYSVVGVLDMHKLPARQGQQIKRSLRGSAEIRVGRKNLILRAFDKAGLESLKDRVQGEPALILTNENPFKLYKTLKQNRSPAAAKAGDIAPSDIIIPKGPTPLPPGPAISTLQKVGLKTSVQAGKIAVMQDKLVVKAGEKVSEDAAAVLGMLKMEPMEIGLNLTAAYEAGMIYSTDVLDIDMSWYTNELSSCLSRAINLSVNTGYPTRFTIDMMISKAFGEARALSIDANIPESQFIGDILEKAVREAKTLQQKTGG